MVSQIDQVGAFSLLPDERSKWTGLLGGVPALQALVLVDVQPPVNVFAIQYKHWQLELDRDTLKITGAAPAPQSVQEFLRHLEQRAAQWTDQEIAIYGVTLPVALSHIAERIASSRRILDLEDDWDGEGSPGYDEATWRRATRFVGKSAKQFWQTYDIVPPAPTISEGPEGSIDVVWRHGSRQLLINISADETEPGTYHGIDRKSDYRLTKGTLDPREPNAWLVAWLTA